MVKIAPFVNHGAYLHVMNESLQSWLPISATRTSMNLLRIVRQSKQASTQDSSHRLSSKHGIRKSGFNMFQISALPLQLWPWEPDKFAMVQGRKGNQSRSRRFESQWNLGWFNRNSCYWALQTSSYQRWGHQNCGRPYWSKTNSTVGTATTPAMLASVESHALVRMPHNGFLCRLHSSLSSVPPWREHMGDLALWTTVGRMGKIYDPYTRLAEKLIKSLCGHPQSGKLWQAHLEKQLIEMKESL